MQGLRKAVVVISILSAVLASGNIAVGAKSSIVELHAAHGSQLQLERVLATLNADGSSTITVTDSILPSQHVEYDLQVDLKAGTYTATAKPAKDPAPRPNTSAASATAVTPMSSVQRTLYVQLTTHDPAGVDLAKTFHRLWWAVDNSQIDYSGFIYSELTCWAANPSSLGTHWYNDQCWNSGVSGDSTYVTATSSTHYYNYDFDNPALATYVSHQTAITGYNCTSCAGTYSYSWSYNGEDTALLITTVAIGGS